MSALHVSGVYILCIYVSVWCIYLVYIRECVVYISCVYACFANVRQRAFSYDEIMAFAAIEKASVHCILFMYVCMYVYVCVCKLQQHTIRLAEIMDLTGIEKAWVRLIHVSCVFTYSQGVSYTCILCIYVFARCVIYMYHVYLRIRKRATCSGYQYALLVIMT